MASEKALVRRYLDSIPVTGTMASLEIRTMHNYIRQAVEVCEAQGLSEDDAFEHVISSIDELLDSVQWAMEGLLRFRAGVIEERENQQADQSGGEQAAA